MKPPILLIFSLFAIGTTISCTQDQKFADLGAVDRNQKISRDSQLPLSADRKTASIADIFFNESCIELACFEFSRIDSENRSPWIVY